MRTVLSTVAAREVINADGRPRTSSDVRSGPLWSLYRGWLLVCLGPNRRGPVR